MPPRSEQIRLRSRPDLIVAMTASGLSCSRLARMVGCSKGMIGHLRTGQVNSCAPPLAMKIQGVLAAFLDQPLFDFGDEKRHA